MFGHGDGNTYTFPKHHRNGELWNPDKYDPDNSDTWSCNGLGFDEMGCPYEQRFQNELSLDQEELKANRRNMF